ncbi:response regulator [Brevundimonas goettingensis]|uniref:Response regulator n=1 Tax=Brevundimonas goettingensis TaxID=2774190 RepID=A0A975C609_9CAUL|nr:response regulator [Brevundimonas goettingensis]QTC92227.1 response regulator [Brevundimonas goettingensis]
METAEVSDFPVDALHHIGCLTYEAAETETALALLERHPEISVLFTDINMPGIRDGLALAGETYRQRPDVRVIITSGQEHPTQAQMPPDGRFIAKPYNMDVITEMVRAFPRDG